MQERWRILALLFAVRTAMAFQFQSVAAVAPLLRENFGVGLDDIGFLIGIYLAPGIALALPGGAIGQRYGDKRIVVLGLLLMICGGLMMAFSPSWNLQIMGRLLAGTGGVLLNVLMSKMVTDWFAGKEIATAMAIFVNSWPAGIAFALIALPKVAETAGVPWAFLVATSLVAVGAMAVAILYRAPSMVEPTSQNGAARLSLKVLVLMVAAGLIWGLYNASLSMVFSFGPSMLNERGWTVSEGSFATSLVLWLVALSVPLGGVIADRTGHYQTVLIGGLIAFGLMLLIAARVENVLLAFAVLGLVSGLSAGPIMSLPSKMLSPETRAVGMGIFYTLFYLSVVLAPWIAGNIASLAGGARVTFDIGAIMLVACCAIYWIFRKLQARQTNAEF